MAQPTLLTSPTDPTDPTDPSGSASAEPSLPPRTPYEDAIAGIIADVLGCGDVGVEDHLLVLGGIARAPHIVAQIRRTLGVDIPIADYVESRTVAGLAAAVAARSFAIRRTARPRPLGRRAPDAPPVLSYDQQRLWMENELLPGVVYNVHGRRRLVGVLDVAALENSIRAIITRHETLRTRFTAADGHPIQVVDEPDPAWRIRVEDLSGDDGDVQAATRRILDEESSTPFDLATGPLIRCVLIRISDTEHALGVTMHHIVSDAWSIGLFVRELSALYRVGGNADRAGLALLPVQYRDYAVWQRDWLIGETLDQQVGHWRQHLAGAPPVLALPTAQRRSTSKDAQADRILEELSADETAALHQLCRTNGVTSFMVLYAVLATIFSRWSGQTDIVIGVPVAGRTDPATDQLIGFFVNVLPLRVNLSGNPTFEELLAQVRQVALDGYANAEAPVDILVRDLEIARDPRRTPLFEVVLNVVASPEAEEVEGLVVEPMDTPSLFSRFDVSFTAQEAAGRLRLKLDFATDRCDATMGRVLLGQLRALLRAATSSIEVRLLDELIPDGSALNESALDESAIDGLAAPAAGPHVAVARHAGGRPALVDGTGSWNYAWLHAAAGRVAATLEQRGVAQTGPVGIVRRPSAAFIAALVGCARAGNPYRVVETDDPSLTQTLGISTVLDVAPTGNTAAGTIDLQSVLADVGPADGEPAEAVPADWAVERFKLRPDDRFAVLSSVPGHLPAAMASAFAAGATLILPHRASTGDIAALTAWLRDSAITVAYLDPSIVRAICAQTPAPELPLLRQVFIENAGALLPHDATAVRAVARRCRVIGIYRVGAEGRPLCAYEAPVDWDLRTAPLRFPLGVPLRGAAVALRRATGLPAAIGELAEIWDGADRTGDLGRRWPNGSIEYVAAAGADVTFEPTETVATLRDAPGVRDAVVTEFATDDGSRALLGYIAGPDPRLGTIAIHNHLVARLPEYLVPKQLIVLEALPRTPWGDYDLRALPRPDAEFDEVDEYVAPRTSMERRLTGILEELLGLDRIGIYDSFFELGGFSMLATQLIARVRDVFGVMLAVRDVFESPTVEELAQLVVRAQGELSGLDDLEALLAEIEQSAPATSTNPQATDTDAFIQAVQRLRAAAVFGPDKPEETPESSAAALRWVAAGEPRSVAAAGKSAPVLTPAQEDVLAVLVERRVAGEPLAYLTGRGSFLGVELITAPGALIPRKETELLGAAVLDLVREVSAERADGVRILDLGTGAGNIAVSVAVLEPGAHVVATDLEQDAVAVAVRNVALHDLGERVRVGCGDLFGALVGVTGAPPRFDVAVCNPPYMPTDKATTLPAEIGAHEPLAAFDGGDVGLSVLYRFLAEAPDHVEPGGWVCFELGAGMARVVEKRLVANDRYGELRTVRDATGIVRAFLARTRL